MHQEEKQAVADIMDEDKLSAFFGSPGPFFLGGPRIREFETSWANAFGYQYAITVNSWSSGLLTAVGALGLGPGDEMICSPYTMSASATCALFYGVMPIFADVDAETFTLDPRSVEACIGPRTKAIMIVHLFGMPAQMTELLDIARRYDLRVIEDAAQAPMAKYQGNFVGALGDIGGFSLNYHKHIHTGEGGVIVTNDYDLARRCQLIRNHGENIVEEYGISGDALINTMGGNYRLTELQAAIGLVQLERLEGIVEHRRRLAGHLSSQLEGCPGIRVPTVPSNIEHSWYVYPILYESEVLGISRERFAEAVNAEMPIAVSWDHVALSNGYIRPLYLAPMYQQRVGIGSAGFPFNLSPDKGEYVIGKCPVAERLWREDLLLTSLVRDPLSIEDMDDFAKAIWKVASNAGNLRGDF